MNEANQEVKNGGNRTEIECLVSSPNPFMDYINERIRTKPEKDLKREIALLGSYYSFCR